MKSYEGKINTNFYVDKVPPKEGSQYICLSVILIHSVFKTGKNQYRQVFLEECKYVIKEKKMCKYIIEDVQIPSDESNKGDSEEKHFDEENSSKTSSDRENKNLFQNWMVTAQDDCCFEWLLIRNAAD